MRHLLVIGPDSETADIVSALRARGVSAWADRIGRVAPDFVSFDWADGLLVIDPTPQVECRNVRPISEFRGVRLFASPSLSPVQRAALLDDGFDAVLDWPAPAELVAARACRLLSRAALSAPTLQNA